MSVKRRSTADLVIELEEFHHSEAATRLAFLQDQVDSLKEQISHCQETMDALNPRTWITEEQKQAGIGRLIALAGLARDSLAPPEGVQNDPPTP